MTEDTYTSSVDGAAGHAALFAVPEYDDRPSPAEALADDLWPVVCAGCDGSGGNFDSACDLCEGSGTR